jgi:hypothetical protein
VAGPEVGEDGVEGFGFEVAGQVYTMADYESLRDDPLGFLHDEPEEDGPKTIPEQAYWPKEECNSYIRGSADGVASDGEITDQDALDNWLNDRTYLIQTDTYKKTGAIGELSIRDYFKPAIEAGIFIENEAALAVWGALKDRPHYLTAGQGAASGGAGGPTALPVDFLYSPFVEPALLDETFEIEPVLRAGFLPAFRPGDLDEYIVPHPDRHATIRVMSIDKEVIYATTNFMMEGYTKATKESFKIIESTLGNTLQLNREKYKLFAIKIGLVDAELPFDWLRSWEDKWEKYMRASVLAKNRWRWYILFGGHLIGGYPLQYSVSANAKDEPYSSINMDLFVTDDVRLPNMKRIASENGLTYFRWGGTVYNPDSLTFERTIEEYPTSAGKAEDPADAEYESES